MSWVAKWTFDATLGHDATVQNAGRRRRQLNRPMIVLDVDELLVIDAVLNPQTVDADGVFVADAAAQVGDDVAAVRMHQPSSVGGNQLRHQLDEIRSRSGQLKCETTETTRRFGVHNALPRLGRGQVLVDNLRLFCLGIDSASSGDVVSCARIAVSRVRFEFRVHVERFRCGSLHGAALYDPLGRDNVRLVGQQHQLLPVVVDPRADDDVRQRLADGVEARHAGAVDDSWR